jgi:hypothetical protein
MPLVRIDLLQGKPKEYVAAIGESVHRAMVETIGVPARDHFQVITEHAPGNLVYDARYLKVNRSDNVVFIQIFTCRPQPGRKTGVLQARGRIPAREAGVAAGRRHNRSRR